MNIDRVTPEYIRNSPEPFEDMLFGELTDFVNTIGGKAWRDGRSNKIGFERSISLDFNDNNYLEIDGSVPNEEGLYDSEDITIRLDVERELFDNEYYYTSYDLTYSHELQTRIEDIPEKYMLELLEQLEDYNELNDTNFDVEELSHIRETHTHSYSIAEEDDSIAYSEDITYSWGSGIEVNGESFHSINRREVVHGQSVDDYAFELGAYHDQVKGTDSDPESIIYDAKFAEMTDENSDIDTLFHSEDDHARRIVALIYLLGSDLTN